MRTANGYTQQELARAAGISQTALSNIETGDSLPRMGTAKRLAGLLGVSPLAFFDERLAPDIDALMIPGRLSGCTDSAGPRSRGGLDEGSASVGMRSAAGMRFMALRQELLETLEEEGDPMELLDSLYELKARIEQLEQSLIEDPDD